MASWLGQSDGAVALAGGDDPQTYIAAYVLNAVTGNLGRTMVFLENPPAETLTTPQNAAAVIESIRNGEVDMVVVAGNANPSYSMPVPRGTQTPRSNVRRSSHGWEKFRRERGGRASFAANPSSAGDLAR